MKRSKFVSMLIPYICMITGLHIFKNVWVAILSYHFLIAFVLFKERRVINFKSAFSGWNLRTALFLSVIFSVNGLLFYFLWDKIQLSVGDLSGKLAILKISDKSLKIFILYYCIVTPVLEEFFWREYLNSGSYSLSISDIFFGGYHVIVLIIFIDFYLSIPTFITLTIVAWIWRRTAIKLNGLSVCIVSHLIADVSTMIALFCILVK